MAGLKLGWMIETAWQSASPTGIFEQNLFWDWDTSELHWEIPLKKLTSKTPSNLPNQISRFSVWLRFTPQPQNSNQLGTWKYKILSLNYFLRPISFHPFTNGQTLRSGWEFFLPANILCPLTLFGTLYKIYILTCIAQISPSMIFLLAPKRRDDCI